MIAYVVTEGPLDAELLRRVLPQQLLQSVEVVVAGGVSAAKSLARSLLVRRRTPVAMLIDADAVAPELVQERRQSAEEVVESVAGDVPIKVIVAVPELEIVFFDDVELLTRLLGHPIPADLLALASTSPRSILEQLFTLSKQIRSRADLLKALSPRDSAILQQASPIRDVITFLQAVQERAVEQASAAEAV